MTKFQRWANSHKSQLSKVFIVTGIQEQRDNDSRSQIAVNDNFIHRWVFLTLYITIRFDIQILQYNKNGNALLHDYPMVIIFYRSPTVLLRAFII